MKLKSQTGFSLLEVLLSIGLVLIILGAGIFPLQKWLQQRRLQAEVDRLISAIRFAQQAAMNQGEAVIFCGSSDARECNGQWNDGQIIVQPASGILLKVFGKIPSPYDLSWSSSLGHNEGLRFEPTGFSSQQGNFLLCLREKHGGMKVIISRSGRMRTQAATMCYSG